MGIQPKVTKNTTNFNGCKMLKNTAIIRVRDSNQNQIIMAKSDTKNQKVTKMHPLKKVANCTGT